MVKFNSNLLFFVHSQNQLVITLSIVLLILALSLRVQTFPVQDVCPTTVEDVMLGSLTQMETMSQNVVHQVLTVWEIFAYDNQVT